jgi:hypothetical protein
LGLHPEQIQATANERLVLYGIAASRFLATMGRVVELDPNNGPNGLWITQQEIHVFHVDPVPVADAPRRRVKNVSEIDFREDEESASRDDLERAEERELGGGEKILTKPIERRLGSWSGPTRLAEQRGQATARFLFTHDAGLSRRPRGLGDGEVSL